jgi:hypothetical protein
MQESVEVYVRPNGDRVLLNLYVPRSMKVQFFESIRNGNFTPDVPMNLEFAVLPEWLAADRQTQDVQDGDPPHVRVALASINIHYVD